LQKAWKEFDMLAYPVNLTRDTNGTLLVAFPDVPEANSVGDDREEALINALDALESALEIYFDLRQPVPLPGKARKGQPVVVLPALVTSKILLWNEMLAQNVRKAELARRLKVHMPQVDRLLDIRHSSKIEMVEAALNSLNRSLDVSLA
jgi:antitoxin HicB